MTMEELMAAIDKRSRWMESVRPLALPKRVGAILRQAGLTPDELRDLL